MNDAEKKDMANSFYAALKSQSWATLREMLDDHAEWKLPGASLVSGHVYGADAIVGRFKEISNSGVNFGLEHILLSRDNFALALHNTARRGDRVLDVHLATVCRIEGRKIASIETYNSDISQVNTFFSEQET